MANKENIENKENVNNKSYNKISIIFYLIVFIVCIWLVISVTPLGEKMKLNGTYLNRDIKEKIVIKGKKAYAVIDNEKMEFDSYEFYKSSGISKLDFKRKGKTMTCTYMIDYISCGAYSYDRQ